MIVFSPKFIIYFQIPINKYSMHSMGPSQESEVTSTPTRPVDNVVITTKGLQDRNINILDGMTVENKGYKFA